LVNQVPPTSPARAPRPVVGAINAIVAADGVTEASVARITAQFSQASTATLPAGIAVVTLDPTNPETASGTPDRTTASQLVGSLESVAINKRVLVENEDRIRRTEETALDNLQTAARERRWEVDFDGVASAM